MQAWKLNIRRALTTALITLISTLGSTAFAADPWPTKQVTMVVPYVAGGATDIVARIVAQKLGEMWGQTVVVDNRAGAGGNIGAAVVAHAAPDGHMLLMGSGALTINPHIYKDLGFNMRDLTPITNVAAGPMVVAVSTAHGPQTLKELIDQAKAKPGSINFGSAGIGSQVHMAGESFAAAAGVDIVHVPYKGEAAAYSDLMAGHVQLVVGNIGPISGFVTQGRLRALAVTSKERAAMLPDAPTTAEAGLPGFENTGWFGLLAPTGTPAAVIEKIYRDTGKVLAMPDVKETLAKIGMAPIGNSPAEFAAAMDAESKRWAEIVRKRQVKTQ
ncbi:MAG TPA: tripartite tricarboxylate transporter substrate binding protein [Ramlibacter sp.]|jgi:tripartite-type tricarboxylate transporter receptor subunit TctC|nr:tripartite tricarboxylate transporter substrate binding protein [Ramlibacter sp.]